MLGPLLGTKERANVLPSTTEKEPTRNVSASPDVVAVINEAGQCGRSKSIVVASAVDVYNVTISRRAHMWRKCKGSSKEGTGKERVRGEKTPLDKWNSICGAIRDAANLAIEMGSSRVSTNNVVPMPRGIDVYNGGSILGTTDQITSKYKQRIRRPIFPKR